MPPHHPKLQMYIQHNLSKREISGLVGKNKGKKGEGKQNNQTPTNNVEGEGEEKKNVKFPCNLFQGDHLTYQCPIMDHTQKLLKQKQPIVLKDPFP